MKKYIYIAFVVLLLTQCREMEKEWERNVEVTGPGNYSITDIFSHEDTYITGTYWTDDRGPYCITAKYDEQGELVWHAEYEPPDMKATYGRKVMSLTTEHGVIATKKGVFVHAQVTDNADHINSVLIRYDSLGNFTWVRMVEKPSEESERESMMLVDYAGDMYLAGLRTDAGGAVSIFVNKYDLDGEKLWSTSYFNPAIQFRHIKCDVKERGQLVMAGLLEDSRDFGFIRYDRMGHVASFTQCATAEQEEMLADIEVDINGAVYMTGMSYSGETHNDFLTIAYDNDNNLVWSQRFDGAGHQDDIPRGIAIDESSCVYVTGSSVNEHGTTALVTVKYDREGNEVWHTVYNRKKGESAEPHLLGAGLLRFGREAFQNFAITGTVGNDVVLLSHSTNGFVSWAEVYKCKGKKNRPTALSGDCIAIESITADRTSAIIVKYGKSEQFGIIRWD